MRSIEGIPEPIEVEEVQTVKSTIKIQQIVVQQKLIWLFRLEFKKANLIAQAIL
jgi:hypothetical protein